MSSIYDWSTTAASNSSSDPAINWAEGQAPSTVNNSARQMMGRMAEFVKDQGGTLVAGGTANALTVTANSAFASYASGQMLAFKAAVDNTGAATLSVNSIGAKSIRKFTAAGDGTLDAGDIKQGGIFVVRYDTAANSGAGGWILENPLAGSNTRGVWTPVLGFSVGSAPDLNVVYSIRQGTFTKLGNVVVVSCNIQTSTFTWNPNVSGSLMVTGLPFASLNTANYVSAGACAWRGITKANFTDVVAQIGANTSTINFVISGSGQSATNVQVGDMPSGGTVILRFTLVYHTS